MSRAAHGIVIAFAIVLSLDVWPNAASAQQPAVPPKIQRTLVPDDRPELWPGGDWFPIPRDEFDELLRTDRLLDNRPSQPRIETAEYSAKYVDDALQHGELTLNVAGPETGAQLLPLEPLNLAVLRSLRWSDNAPAVWGTGRDLRTFVQVSRRAGELRGEWVLAGRRLSRSTEFDVQIPPATVSKLLLELPEGRLLRASKGVVTAADIAPRGGWRWWQVDLGSETNVRLSVGLPEAASMLKPQLLVDSTSRFLIREGSSTLDVEFNLDAVGAATDSFSLSLIGGLDIQRITYGGDLPLTWTVADLQGMKRVVVKLPDPLNGRSRPVRVVGTVPTRFGEPWTLPRVTLEDAVFVGGQLQVAIESSPESRLELRSFQPRGYRQVAAAITTTAGESIPFEQLTADAELMVEVAYPRPAMTSWIVARLRPDAGVWSLDADMQFSARTGSKFEARFALAPEWRVIELRGDSGTESAGSHVELQDDGSQILVFEFRNALDMARPKRLHLVAQRLSTEGENRFALPPIRPLDCDVVESLFAVAPLPDSTLSLQSGSAFRRIERAAAPTFANESSVWKSLSQSNEPYQFFVSNDLQAVGVLQFSVPTVKEQIEAVGSALAAEPRESSHDPAPVADPLITLSVDSTFAEGGSGYDLHRATVRVIRDLAPGAFSFELADSAELTSVALNDRPVRYVRRGTQVELPQLPGESVRTLVVEYRVATKRDLLRDVRSVPVPQFRMDVLSIDWNFALPPGISLRSAPAGFLTSRRPDSFGWLERLFGPIGRQSTRRAFNPLSAKDWREFPSGSVRTTLQETVSTHAPRGYAVYSGVAPSIQGHEFRLVLWNRSHLQLCQWGALLAVLVATLLLRLSHTVWRQRAVACWLGGCAIVSILGPDVLAGLAGAGFSGAIIAVAIPSRVFAYVRRRQKPADEVPMGSTVQLHPFVGLFLAAFIGTATGATWAQDRQTPPPTTATGNKQTDSSSDLEVLYPVDHQGHASTALPVVYVNTALRAHLEKLRAKAAAPSDYLIASADYSISTGTAGAAIAQASFSVFTLVDGPIRVSLPLDGVSLEGPRACLVDGQPHPIVRNSDSAGYIIELSPAVDTPPPVERVVALEFRVPLPAGGREFSFSIPPVAASRLELELPPSVPLVTVPGVREPAQQGVVATVTNFGKIERLRAAWLLRPDAQPQTNVQADVTSYIDVHPARLEHQLRVSLRPLGGELETVTWRLPGNVVVRELKSAAPIDYSILPLADGSTELQIVFLEPATTERAIDARLTLPVVSRDSNVRIPILDLFAPSSAATPRVQLNRYEVGVATSSEYVLTALSPEGENVASLAPEAFLQVPGWNDGRRPQFAYRVQPPAALNFRLSPLVPRRTMNATHDAFISRNRIDWKTSAEITTSDAAAFQHVLQIDPALQVDSVSVEQDGAERLARWAQSGDNVTLFLKDRTTGTQRLTLTGHRPVSAGTEVRLPFVVLAGQENAGARLLVRHAPNVRVLLNTDDRERLKTGSDEAANSDASLVLGEFDVRTANDAPRITVEATAPSNESAASNKVDREEPSPVATVKTPVVSQLSTILWLAQQGSEVGSTRVEFAEPPIGTQKFKMRTGDVVQAVLANGTSLPFVQDANDEITVALPPGIETKTLDMYWGRADSNGLPWFRRWSSELPSPQGVRIDDASVAIAYPVGTQMVIHRSAKDASSDKIDDNKDQSPQYTIASRIPHWLESLDDPSKPTLQKKPDNSLAASLWLFDSVFVSWLVSGLAACTALVALFLINRYRGFTWLERNPQGALIGMGLWWWTCLIVSAVGFLLTLVTSVRVVQRWLAQRRARLPYDRGSSYSGPRR